jgi:hypothetical protein
VIAGVPMPSRALLALTLFVLLAHAFVLRGRPVRLQVREPPRVVAFATRRIEAVPAAGPAEAAATPRSAVAAPPRTAAVALAGGRKTAVTAGRTSRTSSPAAAQAMPPPTANVPAPVQLHFTVTARVRQQQLVGTSELSWQHDGERYEAVFETSIPSMPDRRLHSAGRIGPAGLEPLRFAERNRGEQATHFERDAGRVSFSNNRPATVLLSGAQDRLSILLQLSALFAAAPARYPPGASIAIQTATTRDADAWVFTVEAGEALQLPMGEMTTVKLMRPPRGEYDQRMEVWLAPGAAYVPVRLRLTQPNGDWVDHQWSATDRR